MMKLDFGQRWACKVVVLVAVGSLGIQAGEPRGPLVGFADERRWSDQSGRFEISAKLVFADQTEVQLRKSDGRTVTVPLSQLSAVDKAYIDGFLKAEVALSSAGRSVDNDPDNPFAGGVPSESFASSRSAPTPRLQPRLEASPKIDQSPGAIPVRRAIQTGFRPIKINANESFWAADTPRPFPEVNFAETVLQTKLPKPFFASMQVMAAGAQGTLVLNSYRQHRNAAETYGKFVIANISSGQSSRLYELDQPWKLMAISPDGRRIAAIRVEGFDKGNDLAIFRISDNELVPEYQFTAGGGSWDEIRWVAFLPNDQLATISQKHNLTFWDLSNEIGPKTMRRGPSGGALEAEMTAAGELIGLIVGSNIVLIETKLGSTVGCVIREEPVNKIAFSADGKWLAAFHPFTVTLYSMSDGSEVRRIALSAGVPSTDISWVGEHLLVGSVLYDVERGIPMWTYDGRSTQRVALGSHLVSAFGDDKKTTANVLRIPQPEALRAAENIDPNAIYAIVPGDPVAVTYELGSAPRDVQEKVRSAVEQKLAKLGWKMQPSSKYVFNVKLEQGNQEEAEYFERRGFGPMPFFGPRGFGPRPSGPSTKVRYRPWTQTATITAGEDVLFRSTTERTAPQNLTRKDGESTQQAVLRHCQPWPDYFANLAIPPHLLKREFQGGLGKSTIVANGLK